MCQEPASQRSYVAKSTGHGSGCGAIGSFVPSFSPSFREWALRGCPPGTVGTAVNQGSTPPASRHPAPRKPLSRFRGQVHLGVPTADHNRQGATVAVCGGAKLQTLSELLPQNVLAPPHLPEGSPGQEAEAYTAKGIGNPTLPLTSQVLPASPSETEALSGPQAPSPSLLPSSHRRRLRRDLPESGAEQN